MASGAFMNRSKDPRLLAYAAVKQVGKGSYGEVFLVKHAKEKKQYVMKNIKLTASSAKERLAAEQEAVLLGRLKHPNIVSYKESFQDEFGMLHIVMGYCEGGDLCTRLKSYNGEMLPETQVVEWFVQIALALQYLHERNILHRDLKTQNIFLSKNDIIKVGDLGIARVLDGSCDLAHTVIGTPYYMSPELFANEPYNHKSDIWALGCCVYEMATLKHAFTANNLNALMYKIIKGKVPALPGVFSAELSVLVQQMMDRSANDRPSVHQLLRNSFVRSHIKLFLDRAASKKRKSNQKPPSVSRMRRDPSPPCDSKKREHGGLKMAPSHSHSGARRRSSSTGSRNEVPEKELHSSNKDTDILPLPNSSVEGKRSTLLSSLPQVKQTSDSKGGSPETKQTQSSGSAQGSPEVKERRSNGSVQGSPEVKERQSNGSVQGSPEVKERRSNASVQGSPEVKPQSTPSSVLNSPDTNQAKRNLQDTPVEAPDACIQSADTRPKQNDSVQKKNVDKNPKLRQLSSKKESRQKKPPRPLPPDPILKVDTPPCQIRVRRVSSSESPNQPTRSGSVSSARERRRRNKQLEGGAGGVARGRVVLRSRSSNDLVKKESSESISSKGSGEDLTDCFDEAPQPTPQDRKQTHTYDEKQQKPVQNGVSEENVVLNLQVPDVKVDEPNLEPQINELRDGGSSDEVDEFLTLLDTTLHLPEPQLRPSLDENESPQAKEAFIEKKPPLTSEVSGALLQSGRLGDRIGALRRECLVGLGEALMKEASLILDRNEPEEAEALLLEALGKERFNLYAAKLQHLNLCEDTIKTS